MGTTKFPALIEEFPQADGTSVVRVLHEKTGEVKLVYKKVTQALEPGDLMVGVMDDVVEAGDKRFVVKGEDSAAAKVQDEPDIPYKNDVAYLRIFKTNLLDIVKNQRLKVSEIGILTSMMAFADWNTNRVVHPDSGNTLSVSELARLLGMDRGNLGQAVRALAEKGVILIQQNPEANEKYIVINAQIAHFGKFLSNMEEHQQMWDKGPYTPAISLRFKVPKIR